MHASSQVLRGYVDIIDDNPFTSLTFMLKNQNLSNEEVEMLQLRTSEMFTLQEKKRKVQFCLQYQRNAVRTLPPMREVHLSVMSWELNYYRYCRK